VPELAASLDGPDPRHGMHHANPSAPKEAVTADAPEPGAHRASRRLHAPLLVGMIAVATALLWLRNPASVLAPTLWAEDGTLFFRDAIERGWGALLDPYAGQLVVASRAIAAAVAPLPAAWQPTLYAVAALLLAVLSCAIVLSPRWRDAVPLGARFACLLALVCMPGVGETYGTLSNSHWWLGIGLLLVGMLQDPHSRLGRAGELAFAAAAATSGFVAIYGLPMLAVRALRTRKRHSLLVLGTATLGSAIQVGLLLASPRQGDLGVILADPIAGVAVLAKRVLATIALGDRTLAIVWPLDAPSLLGILAALGLAAAFVIIWARTPRLEVAVLGATIMGGVVLAMWAVTAPGASTGMLFWAAAASRFFLIPKAALLITVVATWSRDRAWRAAVAVILVMLTVGIAADYVVTPLPTVDWTQFARCVDESSAECSTVIPPGWTLEVTGRGR
jgi:hypothetical protein